MTGTTTSLRLARVVLAAAFAALAGLAFGPVFGGMPGPAAFVVAIGSVAAVGIAVAVGTALVPKRPAAGAAVLGSLAVAATVAAVVRPGAEVLNGPLLLLTGALPADPSGPGLAAVAALTGWSVLAAGLIAARGTSTLAPLLPPLGCLVAALAVGAAAPALPTWYALAAVTLAVATLATGRRLTIGHVGTAAVVGVLAVAGAAVLTPAAPGVGQRPPADARALVDAPVNPRAGVSPLQQFPALRNGSKPVRLSGTVSPSAPRLRMVTLTEFDGSYWTVRADYRRAGTVLPAPPPSGARHVEVRHEVRVDLLPDALAWLPSAGRITALSVPDLGVDETTGDLTIPADEDIPTSYTATSALLKVTPDQIRAGDPRRRDRAADVPLPAELRAFADGVARGQPSGAGTLLALYNKFTADSGFRFDVAEDVEGGHGYYQIDKLLRSKRGTAEQYASAFAVLARHLGYDVRVVLGFRPRYKGSTSFTVAATDVDAWVEVRYADLGWVTFDPSPRDNPIDAKGNTAPQPEPKDDPASTAAEDQQRTPTGQAPRAPVAPAPALPESAGSSPIWTVGTIIVVSALMLVLAVPAMKVLRRRRRRRQPARESVHNAWRDTVERLLEAGLPVTPALTTAEIVALTRRRVRAAAPSSLGDLAGVVDRACYAPEEPEPATPRHAWALNTRIRKEVRRGLSIPHRLRAFLDPRPLRFARR